MTIDSSAADCAAEKLAILGLLVRQRLNKIPGVERIDVDGVDLYLVPGFLRKRDCAAIIKAINGHAEPSGQLGGGQEGFRTSFTHHFDHDNPLTRELDAYLSDLIGIDISYSEPMQGQRYQVGQEFKAHHDFFYVNENYWQQEAHRGGQRSWTAMSFLNEPKEGGETEFPLLGISLRPKAGTLVLWNNMDRNGCPNMKTLHAALPVRRGIKHVLTKWYRVYPWRG